MCFLEAISVIDQDSKNVKLLIDQGNLFFCIIVDDT